MARYLMGALRSRWVSQRTAIVNHEQFDMVVVEDACRGIDVNGSMTATHESFRTLGIVRTAMEVMG